jgi:hypothetical protein
VFAETMAEALETGTDLLENEALRRATGFDEPRLIRGEVCGCLMCRMGGGG